MFFFCFRRENRRIEKSISCSLRSLHCEMIRTIARFLTTKGTINPRALAPRKAKAAIDFVSEERNGEEFERHIPSRIMIFKMKSKCNSLREKVAMEDRHSLRHFRINSEDLMEEMVEMAHILSFKVIRSNTKISIDQIAFVFSLEICDIIE